MPVNATLDKFLSHLHDFDAPKVDEAEDAEEHIEDEPPPPPTFTEDELEAAKRDAFQAGLTKGLQDAKASQEQATLHSVQSLKPQIEAMVANEQKRYKLFETDAITLILSIFKHIIPDISPELHQKSIESAVKSVISDDFAHKNIEILCHSDQKEALSDLFSSDEGGYSVSVKAKADIESGCCAINWNNGGALYDPVSVQGKIIAILEQTLEEQGITGQDTSDDTPSLTQKDSAQDQATHDTLDDNKQFNAPDTSNETIDNTTEQPQDSSQPEDIDGEIL